MKSEQQIGIIDTLSLGYRLVNRRPWLIIIPVLLDLFLWLGPRISIQPALERLLTALDSSVESQTDVVGMLQSIAAQSDLFALLALQMPSMIRVLDPASSVLSQRPVIMLDDPGPIIMFTIVLLLIGFLLTMLYRAPIAQVVRGGAAPNLRTPALVGQAWLRLLALLALMIGVALAITVPLAIITSLLTLAGINIILILTLLMQLAVIWLFVYLYFVVDAIVVSEVGPLRAIRYSIAVVRNNFWTTLGFILLSLIIMAGLARIFELFTRAPIGVPVAILAHAYIGSGLAAATMIFYQDRLVRWQTKTKRPLPPTEAR